MIVKLTLDLHIETEDLPSEAIAHLRRIFRKAYEYDRMIIDIGDIHSVSRIEVNNNANDDNADKVNFYYSKSQPINHATYNRKDDPSKAEQEKRNKKVSLYKGSFDHDPIDNSFF